jgi:hypothetical protein
MTIGESIKSISRKEWRGVGWLTLTAIVFSSVPALFAVFVGWSRGLEWRGLLQLSPGDLAFYLSSIQQAKTGHLFFENLFTVEAVTPTLNFFWWLVGRMAAVFSLSPLLAFQLARIALIPVFAVVVYGAISFFFSAIRERFMAFILMLFGSGFGLYFAPLFESNQSTTATYAWPIDLWVSEANGFMSLVYSPHFIAAWILILLALTMLLSAFRSGQSLYALLAGVAALFLFQFHPFHAPTLYLTPFFFLCFLALTGNFRWRDWFNFFLFVIISFWSFAYHVFYFWHDEFFRRQLTASPMLTPAPIYLLIGFGLIVVLAPLGFWLTRRQTPFHNRLFLLVWIVTTSWLVYSPLSFQRRLLHGLEFPLVILSVPAILVGWDWLRRKHGRMIVNYRLWVVSLFFIFCLPSTFAVLLGGCRALLKNQPPIFYFTPNQRQALNWISQNTPVAAAFMSSFEHGNEIVGWAGRRVFVGHWSNSGDLPVKNENVRRFFFEFNDRQRAEFLRHKGIDYVFVDSTERPQGKWSESSIFERVFYAGNIELYRLRTQSIELK